MKEVFCYRNLNRKGVMWSVKDVGSGLVVDRSHTVILKNVKLKVSKAGRARVLKERRRNVHAGVQGQRIKRAPKREWIKAYYNPYQVDSFVDCDLTKIYEAEYAKLTSKGLYVSLKGK